MMTRVITVFCTLINYSIIMRDNLIDRCGDQTSKIFSILVRGGHRMEEPEDEKDESVSTGREGHRARPNAPLLASLGTGRRLELKRQRLRRRFFGRL